jgi:hypothetical protein
MDTPTTFRFTAPAIAALKPRATRQDYWDLDTPGFGIRVTATGIKSWFLRYRPNGSRTHRRWTIGRYPLTATWFALILLTGQRPGEVLAMPWMQLDSFDEANHESVTGWWTVKATKNGDPVMAALSPQAVLCLRALRRVAEAEHARIEARMAGRREPRPFSAYVFPARNRARSTNGAFRDCPMSGNQSNICERIRGRMPSVEHFTPQDLRRTAGTLITRLGHGRFIIDRVREEAPRGVTAADVTGAAHEGREYHVDSPDVRMFEKTKLIVTDDTANWSGHSWPSACPRPSSTLRFRMPTTPRRRAGPGPCSN